MDTVDIGGAPVERPSVSLWDLFHAAAARRRNRTAIVHGERSVSYDELHAMASASAVGLESAGVAAGDIVAVHWARTPESIGVLFGLLSIGAAFAPLRAGDPVDRRRSVMADAQIRLVVACSDDTPVGVDGCDVTRPAELLGRRSDSSTSTTTVGADSLAYVISTSGSGGAPKGVAVPHRGVVNHIVWERRAFPDLPDETFLQTSPLAFDAAIWQIFTPLCVGARLVLPDPAGDIAEPAVRHAVTTLDFVPTQLSAVLASGELPACGASVRRVIVGGETLTPETVAAFGRSMPDTQLINVYGTTEASIDSTWQLDPFPDGVITVGKPIANTRIDIIDPELQTLPVGVEGEIVIAGAGVARGYIARPDETADRFIADPLAGRSGARRYRTGDRGVLRDDGTLEFRGRSDRLVKISGRRIGLDEVDAALTACPGVEEGVTLTFGSAENARLVAVVVSEAGTASPSDVTEWLASQVPAEMLPGRVVLVEQLPKLPSGKVDRVRTVRQLDGRASPS